MTSLLSFYHKWMLNFVRCFFFINWDDHVWLFILHFVNVMYHVDWFADIEPSLNPWNKLHFTGVWSAPMHLRCILLIFIRDFASVFIQDIGQLFSFWCPHLVLVPGNVSFVECFWQVPSSSVFFFPLKNLGKIVLKYWNVCRICH